MGSGGQRAKLIAAFAAVYFIWGSTYLAIRFGVESLPPLLLAGLRSLTAGAILYFVQRLRGAARPSAREWKSAAIAGLGLLWAGNGLVTWAELTVPSGVAALIVATVPLWMAIFQTATDANFRPSRRAWIGIALGLSGVAVITGLGAGHVGRVDPLGSFLIVGSAAAWAAGSVYSRRAALPADTLLSVGMQMLAGGVALLLTGAIKGEIAALDLSLVTARSLWSLFYLIAFGSIVGFSCYGWLLKNAAPVAVSTYAYVNPVVAVFLGAWLGGEAIIPRVLAAGGLILAGVALMAWRPVKPRPALARADGIS